MTKCFAGLDWASRTHAVCLIDARGAVRSEFEVNHDAAGLAELCRRLKAARIEAVAIERPSGLVVDALLEAGLQVVPIQPNVVKATRPRYGSHGGKSDASDAYLLADNSRHANAWAAQIYEKARVRGCDHPHAVRILARAWVRVIWRAWHDHLPYDPHRHAGAILHLAATGG